MWGGAIPLLFASVQQGRALEHAFIALNTTSTHCHACWKNILEVSKMPMPLYFGHAVHISTVVLMQILT